MSVALMHMLDGEYYIDAAFARTGTPDFLEVFKDSVKKGRLTYSGTKHFWKGVLFRPINSRW